MGPAIVGGLLGALAVLIGVVSTEVLTRARDRREKLEESVNEFVYITSTQFNLVFMADEATDEELRNEAIRISNIVSRIDALARWPMRRRREIREEAGKLQARIMATLTERQVNGKVADLLHAVTRGELAKLVFPTRADLGPLITEELKKRGLEHIGLPPPPPPR